MKEVYDPKTDTTYRVYDGPGCNCPITLTASGKHVSGVRHDPECRWFVKKEEPE